MTQTLHTPLQRRWLRTALAHAATLGCAALAGVTASGTASAQVPPAQKIEIKGQGLRSGAQAYSSTTLDAQQIRDAAVHQPELLLTAMATLGAFLYNMAAALLGGVEVTLSEDER